jgi:hypothetical protein
LAGGNSNYLLIRASIISFAAMMISPLEIFSNPALAEAQARASAVLGNKLDAGDF